MGIRKRALVKASSRAPVIEPLLDSVEVATLGVRAPALKASKIVNRAKEEQAMAYVFERTVLPEENELEPVANGAVAPVLVEMKHEASGVIASVTLRVPVAGGQDMDTMHKAAMAEAEVLARAAAEHLEETDSHSLASFVQGE